jgi:hypothetical protein
VVVMRAASPPVWERYTQRKRPAEAGLLAPK